MGSIYHHNNIVVSTNIMTHLVPVDHVLSLVDHWQLAVAPVIHAGVKLPVERLEILESSLDQPPSERESIVARDNLKLKLVILLVSCPMVRLLRGHSHQPLVEAVLLNP